MGLPSRVGQSLQGKFRDSLTWAQARHLPLARSSWNRTSRDSRPLHSRERELPKFTPPLQSNRLNQANGTKIIKYSDSMCPPKKALTQRDPFGKAFFIYQRSWDIGRTLHPDLHKNQRDTLLVPTNRSKTPNFIALGANRTVLGKNLSSLPATESGSNPRRTS